MSTGNELEEACKRTAAQIGVDGRTCFFAECVRDEAAIHYLQDLTRESPEKIERVLRGYVAERYAKYGERRQHGLDFDGTALSFVLAQGYKRGMRWRDVPLGKSCWDICIYQQILQDVRPRTLIELGTGLGGSALFFLDHARMLGLEMQIITIDVNGRDVHPRIRAELGIEFVVGDLKDVAKLLPRARLEVLPHPWLIVEDSHTQIPVIVEHVYSFMVSGDYLAIEDVGMSAVGSAEIKRALARIPADSLLVDTHYTDLFGRNVTSSPDSIFRKT